MCQSKHDPTYIVCKRCNAEFAHRVDTSVLADVAPELVAALRELLDVSCTFYPSDLSIWDAARKRAKAVLDRVGY